MTLHQGQPIAKSSINSEQKSIKFKVIARLFMITYQNQRLRETHQHKNLGYGMVLVIENKQETIYVVRDVVIWMV